MAAINKAKKKEEEQAAKQNLPGGNLMKRLAQIRKKKVLTGALGPLARLAALKKEIDEKKALAKELGLTDNTTVIEKQSELPSQTVSNIDGYDQ